MIAKTAELMERHEAIFLEEPPETNFEKMLTGAISVADYLMPLDLEYPLNAVSKIADISFS